MVDVVQLDIGNEDWNQLGRQIFNNMEILKLGACRYAKEFFTIYTIGNFYRIFTVKRSDNVPKAYSRSKFVFIVVDVVFGLAGIMAQIAFNVKISISIRG